VAKLTAGGEKGKLHRSEAGPPKEERSQGRLVKLSGNVGEGLKASRNRLCDQGEDPPPGSSLGGDGGARGKVA